VDHSSISTLRSEVITTTDSGVVRDTCHHHRPATVRITIRDHREPSHTTPYSTMLPTDGCEGQIYARLMRCRIPREETTTEITITHLSSSGTDKGHGI